MNPAISPTLSISAVDLVALLPVLVVSAASVIVMLTVAFRRRHGLIAWLTVAGLALALATLPVAAGYAPRAVTPLLLVDPYALFFSGLLLATTLLVAVLCYGYFRHRSGLHEELYILLLIATLGALVLVTSSHFASFFLGLEILSIALFALIPYSIESKKLLPIEAGAKYLILASIATTFVLFGMALIYSELGTMEFLRMATLLSADGHAANPYVLCGIALIFAGLGFKLSVVPFHMWTPDVYQGAPAPVTGYLATVSKGAAFALLLRYFVEAELYNYEVVLAVLSVVAVLSMLVGNLLALMQRNVKRLLAYSSIAHMGYLLVALIAGGALALEAVSYYLVAYFVMTLGAFAVVSLMSHHDGVHDRDHMDDYAGLFWRHPWLAGAFTAMLLSLAGIPLTVGFLGKFYVLAAGVNARLWLLVFTLVAGSVIGLYYYLRLIIVMFDPGAARRAAQHPSWLPGNLVLAALTLALLWLGIFPAALIALIQASALKIA